MRANSPSSVAISLIIHAFIAAIIFFTTVYVTQRDKPPVIFELVAGPPTAPEQLVAPKLGNTKEQVKLEVPKTEVPVEQPAVQEPPQPETHEVAPPTPPATVKTTQMKPKSDDSITKQLKKSERISYQQYRKAHPTPKPVPPSAGQKAANVPRVDVTGIAGGLKTGSTANNKGGGNGKALTREEQDEQNTYISFLLQALKDAHEPPPGVSDQLKAEVTFDITASGAILSPRISKSSGNREFDESVLAAFRKTRSIGPTPDGKPHTWTIGFKMKDET